MRPSCRKAMRCGDVEGAAEVVRDDHAGQAGAGGRESGADGRVVIGSRPVVGSS